jgi:hypothetical protein
MSWSHYLNCKKNYPTIPQSHELLIEHIEDKDGYHLMVYIRLRQAGARSHEFIDGIIVSAKQQPLLFPLPMK